MDVPGIVRERLADERRMTSVNVGGDDRVYITPPKTLVYRAAGLFSSESIEEFPHDVARFDVSADRREATFAFEYEHGVEAFSAPRERIETILPPVLAGILRTTGRIDDEERIEESYRFGERTLIVTERRLLTSVGEAVWDRESDSYDYERITDLRFEEDLRIDIDGRPRYIELDGDGRREAYETLESALCAYHGVASIDQLPDRTPERATTDPESERTADAAPAESDVKTVATDPIDDDSTGQTTDSDASGVAEPSTEQPAQPRSEPTDSPGPLIPEATESDPAADEPTAHDESGEADEKRLADEVDALSERVERQTELLERQTELLERLVEEASTGRVNDDR
jgi:HAMP domain-containing protein